MKTTKLCGLNELQMSVCNRRRLQSRETMNEDDTERSGAVRAIDADSLSR